VLVLMLEDPSAKSRRAGVAVNASEAAAPRVMLADTVVTRAPDESTIPQHGRALSSTRVRP
jgi:hypothetical protein